MSGAGSSTIRPVFRGTGERRAFSFAEIMVLLVVIAIGLFPVLNLFTSTTSDISSTVKDVMLLNYSNELLDSVLSFNYDEIPVYLYEKDIKRSANAFAKRLSPQLSEIQADYSRELKITLVNAKVRKAAEEDLDIYSKAELDAKKKIKMVTAIVTYNPSGGKSREIKNSVLITKE